MKQPIRRVLGIILGTLSTVTAFSVQAVNIDVPAQHPNIQSAIDAANNGDQIRVSAGTYNEIIDFKGKDIQVRAVSGPKSTTINGNGASPVVLIDEGVPGTAVFAGFTVTGGVGDAGLSGGGIKCAGSNVEIFNNIIRNNSAARGAGLLMVDQFGLPCNARVHGNIIENNSAVEVGGGIAAINSSPVVEDNIIRFNTVAGAELDPDDRRAGPAGGGIYINKARGGMYDYNVIYSNSAEHAGGGVFAIISRTKIRHNRILKNVSRFGAGVHLEANSDPVEDLGIELSYNSIALNVGRNVAPGDTAEVMGAGLGGFGSHLQVAGNSFLFNENQGGAECDLNANPGRCAFGGGVGIFSDGKDVEVELEHNIMAGNKSNFGGGAWLAGVGMEVESKDNRFFLNKADSRPGLGCQNGSTCNLDSEHFQLNMLKASAPTAGSTVIGSGAVDFFNAAGKLTNSVIWKNRGQFGAVRMGRSDVDVLHNLLLDNAAIDTSGGLIMGDNGASMFLSPDVSNNIFSGNSIVQIAELGGVSAMVYNNLFNPGTGQLYSDWDSPAVTKVKTTTAQLNALPEGDENIGGGPGFVGGPFTALCRDFHLKSDSPAVNNARSTGVLLDRDGDDRTADVAPDIGVDEFTGAVPPRTCADISKVGLYDPVTGTFHLDTDNNGEVLERTVSGLGVGRPLIGDMNGDGVDDLGVFLEPSATFRFDTNGDGQVDFSRTFGRAGDKPVVGDWDGDGDDDIGIYRETMGVFFLDLDGTGPADWIFQYGPPKSEPIAGDWNGDGRDEVGVFKLLNRTFYLNMSMTDKAVTRQYKYGAPNIDLPLAGDWNGDGVDEIAIYRDSWKTVFQDGGEALANERQFRLQTPGGMVPVAGDW